MTCEQISKWSAERAFLLSAVRLTIGGSDPVVVEKAIDWTYLMEEAAYHGLTPMLWRYLDALGPQTVPVDVYEALHRSFQENLKRNLLLTGELWRVLELCRDRGIPAIPFKGPTLAMLAYGDLAWRTFTDLDLLVDKRDLAKVGDLLASAGYQSRMDARVLSDPAFTSVERESYFSHPRSGALIDLQWRLSSGIMPFDLDMESIHEHQMTVRPGGKEIGTLRLEDLLLYVCVHGSRHCWSELKWIADVAGLIHLHPELDWDLLLRQARKLRCERVLLHSLLLAQDLFDMALPPVIEHADRADAVSRELATMIGQSLMLPSGSAMSKLDLHWYFLKLQRGPVNQIRHLWRQLFLPTVIDWEFCPLPRGLMFLYPFVRILRLVGTFAYYK